MALDLARLRLMTFPQRIIGRALEVNVLLPTQGLLNIEAPFASVLDPATTVQLPRFIGAAFPPDLPEVYEQLRRSSTSPRRAGR